MDHRGTSVLMHRYELGRLLGQGTFAKVYHARNIETGQSVAIKVIEKEKAVKEGAVNQIKREISVMRIVRHPYIINLYEVMATKTKIYFVMEYAKGGELFNKVVRRRLKEDFARKYFHQLINAVEFCHSRGVYHRDLKPENILLDENNNLKVSDFGLSALSGSKHREGLLHTVCGTPAYVAPEVINRKGKIGKSELKFPSWFKADVRRLIFRMLDPHPSTRITIAKIKENSWYKKGLSSEPSGGENLEVAGESGGSSSSEAEGQESSSRPSNLNAFDIISLSAGFDLSRLFEDSPCCKKEHRFISWKPASTVISKLEEVAKRLRLKISKKEGGMFRFEGTNEGRKGTLSIDTEVFELAPDYHLVEVKKRNGDTLEYRQVFDEGMRPCLKDIVWEWQDEPKSEPENQEEDE